MDTVKIEMKNENWKFPVFLCFTNMDKATKVLLVLPETTWFVPRAIEVEG